MHNQDHSGQGSLPALTKHLTAFQLLEHAAILSADSLSLSAADVTRAAQGPVRMFSIDGSHTEAAVLSDLRLAEASLAEGGLVLLDDALNADWPGVAAGLARYSLEQQKPPSSRDGSNGSSSGLLPFALGYNKAFLARREWREGYFQAVLPFARKCAVFLGHECAILPQGWIATHFGNDPPRS
eukprot:g82184.t1